MQNRLRVAIVILVSLWLLSLLAVRSAAAAETGTLTGVITDPSGAVIPGATVRAASAAGGIRETQSGLDGRYVLAGLAPGKYTVSITAPDMAPFARAAVEVKSGATLTLDAGLELSVTKEEITVSDTNKVELDPSSNVGAIVLKGSDLDALPDDPDELQADLEALAGPAAGPNGGQLYIDGFSGGSLPPKSSIREIRINQNPFSAEYDRMGFGRIEIFTKPGTDRFHGQAFFNFGDSLFNSRNPFAPDKPAYQTRMMDASVGGPLNRRASFFVNAERHAVDEAAVVNALTLDPSLNVTSFRQTVMNPMTRTTFSPRLDYQLSPNHTLAARYSFTDMSRLNQGTGEFSLPSRAYDTSSRDHTLQLTETAVLNPKAISETRFQFIHRENRMTPGSADPTLQVLGAFTGGGAGVGQSYTSQNHFEWQNVTTLTRGGHLVKFGGRLRALSQSGSYLQGYNGTFTFTSLEAYRITLAGLNQGLTLAQIRALGGGPSQFSITGGNPLAGVRQWDAGLFAQDDWRLRPNFTLNLGLRYETQTHIGDHLDLAPRVGFAWGLGAKGRPPKTVIRGGFGLFYDRVDESLTLEALRLNGINQQQFLVPFPDFYPQVPSVETLAANRLPSAIRELDASLRAPYVAQAALSLERQLPKNVSLSITYANSRGLHVLRSRNINAPLAGAYDPLHPAAAVRPYPGLGDLYLYESTGIFKQHQLITNVSARVSPKLTLFGFYALGKAESNADGAGSFPANQYDLSSEWGRAGFDVRHRAAVGGSLTAPFGLRLSPFITASSGRPFDITVGRDLNGDSLFNDRPAFATDLTRPSAIATPYGVFDTNPLPGATIIPRNWGSGPGQFTLNLRLSRSFGFGGETSAPARTDTEAGRQGPPPGGPGGPGGGGPHGGGPGGHMGAGGGMRGGPGGLFGEGSTGRRYSLTFSIAARNLLNHVNLGVPVGNLSSPLFGTSTTLAGGFGPGGSATANRRIEMQVRFTF